MFYVNDQISNQEYLYGVGRNMKSLVKSEDNGLNWKIISDYEFNTV